MKAAGGDCKAFEAPGPTCGDRFRRVFVTAAEAPAGVE
jgi:hypothetical protein